MKNLTVLQHSLLQDRLTRLRNRETGQTEFILRLRQISHLLASHAAASLPLVSCEVQTPMEKTEGAQLKQGVTLIPILRAALGMVPAFQDVVPEARIGHLGYARHEETLEANLYIKRLPSHLENDIVWLLDPMLATGHSSSAALDVLKKAGATQLKLICCLASPEGVAFLEEKHPDVSILTASLERQLNDQGFILPGLGDAGDRQFGTF